MSTIDPDSLAAVKPELLSGEIVLWAGRPDTSVLFHREDLFLIPFSLMWGGFAVLWESASLAPTFVDIPYVDSVYRLVSDLQAKAL